MHLSRWKLTMFQRNKTQAGPIKAGRGCQSFVRGRTLQKQARSLHSAVHRHIMGSKLQRRTQMGSGYSVACQMHSIGMVRLDADGLLALLKVGAQSSTPGSFSQALPIKAAYVFPTTCSYAAGLLPKYLADLRQTARA